MVQKNEVLKSPDVLLRNGHELAPLNHLHESRPGVTIMLSSSRTSSISAPGPDEDDPDRAAWSGKVQFFLSIIGYSVGLGNIWRFPYLCQQNGGGAFLIPFSIMLVLEGIPLFLIELGIGQKMRLGSLGVWNTIHPWLGGIGISACVVTFFVSIYYNIIISWCFFYLFNSFQNPLPWQDCPMVNGTVVPECDRSSETAYFWYRTTLDAAPSIELGAPKWWILLCLLLSWIVVFCIVMKGIQSSGRIIYFTSLFPYLVLTIFFIRGVTLRGAGAGLIHMYTPKIHKLLDPQVWLDAATQVFYSFGLAFGSLIAFGSYNQPKNNCVRDVILVTICNAATAIYASVVIFAILGFKAVTNVDKCILDNKHLLVNHGIFQDIDHIPESDYLEALTNSTLDGIRDCSLQRELDAAAEGTGLAFIVFTQAIVELPAAPFWAVIFFMMLLSLGLGSQIGILEGMLCTIFDIELLKRFPKQYITAVVCVACFLVGIIFTTGAGEYWLKMFDSFAGTIGLVVVALMEMISVIYIYGHERFTNDIYEMTGVRPGLFWQLTWRLLGPLLMSIILVASVISMVIEHPKYHAWIAEKGDTEKIPYPPWILGVAIFIVIVGILPIPLVFLLRRYQCLKIDINIHEGSIRRIDTTVSTKEMITDVDQDDDDDGDDNAGSGFGKYRTIYLNDENDDSDFNNRRGRSFRMEVIDDDED